MIKSHSRQFNKDMDEERYYCFVENFPPAIIWF
jgi:hypothetical protein